jgi:hypothetical protein
MPYESFEVYLNDHLAGATAGVNVAQQAAERNRSTELGAFYAEIASEIKADFDTFEGLMESLGVGKSAGKTTVAEMGSKVAELKFGGDDSDTPRLGDFVTLEALSIGVEGKLCMWKALEKVTDAYPALVALDLATLKERASDQRERIELKRLEIAPLALAHQTAATA